MRFSTVAITLDCQSAGIANYAQGNGFEVCQTYCDEAKSGLEIGRRRGLSQLFQDVVGTKQFYKAVLVYDVSRLGSFQDPDEATHYELLCKADRVQVHYYAEHFSNDGRPASLILKTLKRVMAAEYSRELSDKVFAGMTRMVIRGFRAGAYPGYGFRRMLVSDDGIQRQQLSTDEQKSIVADRVILAPGPATEVRVCRSIRLVTKGRMWALPAARNERCRITLMAGMKPENEVLEAFCFDDSLEESVQGPHHRKQRMATKRCAS